MKIKTKQKLNLPELIQHVWDEQIKSIYGFNLYRSNLDTAVEVDMSGQVSVHGQHYGSEVYTMIVMEELTEDTEFEELWEVHFDVKSTDIFSYINRNVSITDIKEEDAYEGDSNVLAIYYKDTLIWSKDAGIPAEGVIEE